MNKVTLSVIFVALFLFAQHSEAKPPATLGDGSIIVAEGFSAPNDFPIADIPADINGFSFVDWCNDVPAGQPSCITTVELEVFDAKKDESLGHVYAWGKEFGGSADRVSLENQLLTPGSSNRPSPAHQRKNRAAFRRDRPGS